MADPIGIRITARQNIVTGEEEYGIAMNLSSVQSIADGRKNKASSDINEIKTKEKQEENKEADDYKVSPSCSDGNHKTSPRTAADYFNRNKKSANTPVSYLPIKEVIVPSNGISEPSPLSTRNVMDFLPSSADTRLPPRNGIVRQRILEIEGRCSTFSKIHLPSPDNFPSPSKTDRTRSITMADTNDNDHGHNDVIPMQEDGSSLQPKQLNYQTMLQEKEESPDSTVMKMNSQNQSPIMDNVGFLVDDAVEAIYDCSNSKTQNPNNMDKEWSASVEGDNYLMIPCFTKQAGSSVRPPSSPPPSLCLEADSTDYPYSFCDDDSNTRHHKIEGNNNPTGHFGDGIVPEDTTPSLSTTKTTLPSTTTTTRDSNDTVVSSVCSFSVQQETIDENETWTEGDSTVSTFAVSADDETVVIMNSSPKTKKPIPPPPPTPPPLAPIPQVRRSSVQSLRSKRSSSARHVEEESKKGGVMLWSYVKMAIVVILSILVALFLKGKLQQPQPIEVVENKGVPLPPKQAPGGKSRLQTSNPLLSVAHSTYEQRNDGTTISSSAPAAVVNSATKPNMMDGSLDRNKRSNPLLSIVQMNAQRAAAAAPAVQESFSSSDTPTQKATLKDQKIKSNLVDTTTSQKPPQEIDSSETDTPRKRRRNPLLALIRGDGEQMIKMNGAGAEETTELPDKQNNQNPLLSIVETKRLKDEEEKPPERFRMPKTSTGGKMAAYIVENSKGAPMIID